MSIAMKDVKINSTLLKAISEIAKDQNTTENEIIKEFILKGIAEIEDGIDIEIVAEEFGQTKEELIKELEDADERIDNGEGIELDVDKLEERYL